MVFLNSRDSIKVKKDKEKVVWMAMGPERSSSSSKPLHNFTMPCGLRWGNQRFLRCMKVNSNGEISAVERRPSSSSSVPAVSNASANNTNSHASGSNDFISITGKRKEREKFKDPPSPSDHRRGSDNKKAGSNFKLPRPPSQQPSSSTTTYSLKFRSSETGGGEDGDGDGDGDGIVAVREKLIFDLQTAADEMKDAILREELETEYQDNPPTPAPAVAPTVGATVASSEAADGSVRPWNLRTRRAACKAPTANGFVSGFAGGAGTSGSGGTTASASPMKGLKVDIIKPNSSLSPLRAENKSPRLRSGVATAETPSCEKKERVKFSVPLTRREIEEDFLAIAGRRPPRRPQKRPKYVQKQLDTLFPGLWLTEITADMYKVPETQ